MSLDLALIQLAINAPWPPRWTFKVPNEPVLPAGDVIGDDEYAALIKAAPPGERVERYRNQAEIDAVTRAIAERRIAQWPWEYARAAMRALEALPTDFFCAADGSEVLE